MGDKSWRASSVGPDWRDVRTYQRAIEKTHSGVCYVGLQPDVGGGSSAWHVNAVLILPILNQRGDQVIAGVSGNFPDRDHKTLEAFVYFLLSKLDWTMAQGHYGQAELPLV